MGPGATWRDATVRADGAFQFAMLPGTYALTGTSPLYDSGRGVCRADGPVVVFPGQIAKVDVLCQEK